MLNTDKLKKDKLANTDKLANKDKLNKDKLS